jgi:hypothetical protein
VYVSLSMCVDAGMGGLGEWGETLFFFLSDCII